MWTAVLGFGAKVGKLFVDLANAAIKWAAVLFAYRLGKKKAEADQLEDAAEVQHDQLDIAARRPRDRSDVIDRMRDDDL